MAGTRPRLRRLALRTAKGRAENRSIAVEEQPENAGHGAVTVFVDDLDTLVDEIVAHGIEPTMRETYDNGVRKVTFHDPDGNEIGFGGGPK